MGTDALRQQGRAAPCRTGANRKPATSPALAPLRTDTFIVTTSFGSHIREKPGGGGGGGGWDLLRFTVGRRLWGWAPAVRGKRSPAPCPGGTHEEKLWLRLPQ